MQPNKKHSPITNKFDDKNFEIFCELLENEKMKPKNSRFTKQIFNDISVMLMQDSGTDARIFESSNNSCL